MKTCLSTQQVKRKIYCYAFMYAPRIRKAPDNLRHRAFTLVELMLAVVIFSIGIVFILQSFLAVGRAFGSSQHIFHAVSFLEERMAHIKEISLREEGVVPGHGEGQEIFDSFDLRWQEDLVAIEEEEGQEEEEEIKNLVQVTLLGQWQEGGVTKNISLITYLPLHVAE